MTLVALSISIVVLFSFSIKTTTLTQAQCLPDQRHALIQLNQGFNTTKLHSWNASTDCCIWDGITCDKQTGMVTALNLAHRHISGELNLALFNLSSLRYLNLAWNDFINISLPQTGFEQLANLTHLDLSYSSFSGQVPIGISALTNLISLDLSDFSGTNNLYLHDIGLKTLLNNLTKIQVLRLDGVDISLNGSEWGNAVFQVGPTLQELSMKDCGLEGNFPEEIIHLTNLTYLDLSFNSMLSGQLSDSIGNMQYLSRLVFNDCSFYGEIMPSITNLTRLVELDISTNRLTGTIPMSLFSHPTLETLDLSYNQLSGYLSEFSNGSLTLKSIKLDYNNLQGRLPISLFKSPNLEELTLESNYFNGTFNLDVLKHSKNLDSLGLSNNKLSIIEGKNHNKSLYSSFPQMGDIQLASCNLTKFPSFLSYQKYISNLNLSNNSLTGDIPLSICNATIGGDVLDLSYNSLTGTIPPCLLEANGLAVLNLKSNRLSGPLLRNISHECNFITINLSENRINGRLPQSLMNCMALEILDVGNNQIVHIFPSWLGNLEILRVLVLRSNQFYDTISNMETKIKTNNFFFPALRVLDLSSNQFRGIIPKIVFENLMALANDSFDKTFRFAYLYNSITAFWKGQEMEMKKSLRMFRSLDLSHNGFSGEIPEEIGQLKSLDVLSLSHNDLTGPIPSEFANLHQLQSLDLSSNQLSGHIPQELIALTFLASLNLSYNNLVGEIPQAGQFSTFSNTSYMGNLKLCGCPLSMQCAATPSIDANLMKVFLQSLLLTF